MYAPGLLSPWIGRVSATALSIVFAGGPLGLAAGAALVAHLGFQVIYVIIAGTAATAAVVTRGGRTRRFTARRTPAWRTADQME